MGDHRNRSGHRHDRRITRTVVVLAAVALAIYGGFIARGVLG